MDRRSFIRSTVGSFAIGFAFTRCAQSGTDGSTPPGVARGYAPARLETIGLQLYTVRTLMEKDFEATLRQVAAIGFKEFEFAGLFERKPADVRALMDELNVTAPSTHIPIGDVRTKLDDVMETAKVMGHSFIVVPWLPEDQRNEEGYRRLAMDLNTAGDRLKKENLKLAYHNHDFEFKDAGGRTGYDLLLQETDPEVVAFELDLFWARKAGHEPLDLFKKAPGRFPLVHVKDMDAAGDMAAVGEGNTDFGAIFAQSSAAGILHYFVEHDNPKDPIGSITTSYETLSA